VSLIVLVVVLVELGVWEPLRSVYAYVYSGPCSTRSSNRVVVEMEVLDKTERMIVIVGAADKQLLV
jgi:hypothetical protein